MIRKSIISLCFIWLLINLISTCPLYAQNTYDEFGWLPEKENHLVYDYYGILDTEQKNTLETRLLAFNDSTSNQIVIMVTPGFGGRDISSFAIEVGREWGIGQEKMNNGVIIVVKPKDQHANGQVEIATGKGLEGALPDIFCKRIIEDEMIPHFRDNDYYGGIVAALDVILPVCSGEYSYDKYKKDNDVNPLVVLIVFILGAALFCWVVYKLDKMSGGNGFSGGNYTGGTFSGNTYSGGHTRVGGWGGGSFGGSSGGFGGFGGGSFGGGGARGSW